MKLYVGYDPRDELAFRACVSSARNHSNVPLEIYPIKDHELRRHEIYSRPYRVEASGQMIDGIDGRPFSTQFSFTRFAIPLFDKSSEWVIFCDADFLWRDDIGKLFALADDSKKLMCVQHDYSPPEITKFDGMLQQKYRRKNWSSLMMFKPSELLMSKAVMNNASGRFLHQFKWLADETLGALPQEWNWLEGWSEDGEPSAVHYTRGTPDMLGKLPYDAEWWEAVEAWRPGMNFNGIPCV